MSRPRRNGFLAFDLDGTLTDPKQGITTCIIHALRQMGASAPAPEDLEWCIGPPLLGSFTTLLDGDGEGAKRALQLYRERFADVGLFENRVYPDIPESLDQLSERGNRLVVATSKPRVYARRIIEHFGLDEWIAEVYGSDLSGALTDKSDLLAHVLIEESVHDGAVVMVGDRGHDVQGAHTNGMACVGVLYGYGSREELTEAGADVLCENPSGLPGVIQQVLQLTYDGRHRAR